MRWKSGLRPGCDASKTLPVMALCAAIDDAGVVHNTGIRPERTVASLTRHLRGHVTSRHAGRRGDLERRCRWMATCAILVLSINVVRGF